MAIEASSHRVSAERSSQIVAESGANFQLHASTSANQLCNFLTSATCVQQLADPDFLDAVCSQPLHPALTFSIRSLQIPNSRYKHPVSRPEESLDPDSPPKGPRFNFTPAQHLAHSSIPRPEHEPIAVPPANRCPIHAGGPLRAVPVSCKCPLPIAPIHRHGTLGYARSVSRLASFPCNSACHHHLWLSPHQAKSPKSQFHEFHGISEPPPDIAIGFPDDCLCFSALKHQLPSADFLTIHTAVTSVALSPSRTVYTTRLDYYCLLICLRPIPRAPLKPRAYTALPTIHGRYPATGRTYDSTEEREGATTGDTDRPVAHRTTVESKSLVGKRSLFTWTGSSFDSAFQGAETTQSWVASTSKHRSCSGDRRAVRQQPTGWDDAAAGGYL